MKLGAWLKVCLPVAYIYKRISDVELLDKLVVCKFLQ